MIDIMINIETLGTRSNAAVLSIGAVEFDLETGKLGRTLYTDLELQPQLDAGRKLDADTFYRWMKQSKEAQEAFLSSVTLHPLGALAELSHFIHSANQPNVWGNGSSFDISILESLYQSFNIPVPWCYNEIHDFRTFRRFVGSPGSRIVNDGVAHNALDYAISQAKYVINEYRKSNHK